MPMLNQDCRDCSHKNMCGKKTDYISYIFALKDAKCQVPEGVDVVIRCRDFLESVPSSKHNSDPCCAPGWGDDRPSVEYSTGV